MKKKALIYADGSLSRGTGHLARSIVTAQKISSKYNSTFIHTNKFQEIYFADKNIKSLNVKSIYPDEYDLIIIDSKTIFPKDIKTLSKNIQSLYIDTISKDISRGEMVIFPSFFLSLKTQEELMTRGINFKYGTEWMLLRDEFLNISYFDQTRNITVSFGGTDPNNLTQLFLDNIGFIDIGIRCLIGRHNKNRIEIPANSKNSIKLINDNEGTARIFKSSDLVITALGTTIQELYYLRVPFGIIYNYKSDLDDIKALKEHLEGEGLSTLLRFSIFYGDLSSDYLANINYSNKEPLPFKNLKGVGNGWVSL